MFRTFSILAGLTGLAALLSAQTSPYPDTYKVNYFSNAIPDDYVSCDPPPTYPDAIVQITNVGAQIGSKTDPSGNLCAMIYVFDPNQELSECCGCAITPDGLLTLSVDNDLTANPLTGSTLSSGVIKIVSSAPTKWPSCDPTKPVPTIGVRAWGTHIQNQFETTNFETETEFSDGNLSAGELKSLEAKCQAVGVVGSGSGICSCGQSKPH